MRLGRIAALVLVVVLLVCAGAAIWASYNQDRILKFVLDRAKASTGFEIVPSGGSLALGPHLTVVLQHPRLLSGQREIASAAQVKVLVSYHALVYNGGLPFFAVFLDHPQAGLPPQSGALGVSALPRFDASTPAAIRGALGELSVIARRVEITDGSVTDARGASVLSHLDLKLYARKHLGPSLWRLRFGFTWNVDPIAGAQFSGDLTFGLVAKQSPHIVARGQLWGWNVALEKASVLDVPLAGLTHGDMTITLLDDGQFDGSVSVAVKDLAVKKKEPIALGDCSVRAAFDASANRVELTDVTLRQGGALMLAGQCRIDRPYDVNTQIGVLCGGLQADLSPLKRMLKSNLFGFPAWLVGIADRINAGRVRIDEMGFDSSLADLGSTGLALAQKFSVDARVEGIGIALPPETKLPPVRDGVAKVSYVHGLVVVSQGTLRAGHSVVSDLNVRADFTKDLRKAPYEIRMKGEADVGELYPWLAETAGRFGVEPKRWMDSARGPAGFELNATGRLEGLNWAVPGRYRGTITPRGVRVTLRNSTNPVVIAGGRLAISPDRLNLGQVRLDLNPGAAILNGDIDFASGGLALHEFAVEMQKVPADKWLPLAVGSDQIAIRGDVDGRIGVNTGLGKPVRYSVDGGLSIGPGAVQFGFIRAPMLVSSTTLKLNGHNAVLDIPSSTLEGQRVDMKVTITDLQNPVVRIDAVAQVLDLEALKFVRLPWSPKTPSSFPSGKTTGHIEVRRGNLSKLPFSDLKTDFEHDRGDWRVYNLRATSLGGRIDLSIIGRAPDDWIHMKGHVAGMDSGALFMLFGERKPLVRGKLYGDFDLWGDTDTDFFNTLAGKTSIAVKNGRLEKFTLLSRLLGLIDLKNWLSAQVQDPRATGLPFKFVTADFAGSGGSFYTENLLLVGPVMDVTAQGSVDVGEGSLAMEVGMLPFQTVSWLVRIIPLIGKGLSQSSGQLLAAYFRVKGPFSNPRITPEPFTSAAEIVKKTLTLPLNLLLPNSVK